MGSVTFGTVSANTPVRSDPSTIGTHTRTPSDRPAITGRCSTNARPAIVDATASLDGSSECDERPGNGSNIVCAKSMRYTTTSDALISVAILTTTSGTDAGSAPSAIRIARPRFTPATARPYR